MKNYIKFSITGIILSLVLSLAIGCRGTNDSVESEQGPASVKVILKGEDFSDTGNIGAQASSGRNSTDSAAETEQRQEIALKNNNDYKIVATLTPAKSVNTSQASSKANLIAATETNPLPNGTRYKVVVFDNSGNYLTEQDYVSGQAGSDITGLDGGSAYTFIVYSIGSSTDLPIVTYVDPLNKTLATASVNNVSGDNDLMYFSKTMTVSGNGTNYLDTVLRHRFSQVTTTIDASPTQVFTITGITTPQIFPHYNSASLKLSDGGVTASGNTSRNLTFPTLGTAIATANPVLINPLFETANQSDMVFSIANLTLQANGANPIQISHQFAFSRFRIGRGIKYNLNLAIVPNDQYLTFRGYPAVKINGMIFMRHNLGSNYLADPDVPSPDIVGNYYQWGRIAPVANATTGTGPIAGWDNTTVPQANAWNLGSLSVPQKNRTNDPCPDNWRVASRAELGFLANPVNTTYTYIGNTQTTSTSSAAGVFTSKFNPNVKVTMPFTGFRNGPDGSFAINGTTTSDIEGEYWSSSQNVFGVFSVGGTGFFSAGGAITQRGMPVRCVATYPY